MFPGDVHIDNERAEDAGEVLDHPDLDAQFSATEVRVAIDNAVKKGTWDWWCLPGECFKAAGDIIAPFLRQLFDAFFIPIVIYVFGHNLLLCLFINREINETEDYRGISLLSIPNKLFSF